MSSRKIAVFDTTLRDGEQSPGIALRPEEKAEVAGQLERLGVDVIEAGFAAASPGDAEGVRATARAVESVTVASLARTRREDDAAVGLSSAALAAAHLPRRDRSTWRKAADDPARSDEAAATIAYIEPRRRDRVLMRGRDPFDLISSRWCAAGRSGGRRRDQPPGHDRLPLPASTQAREVSPRCRPSARHSRPITTAWGLAVASSLAAIGAGVTRWVT